MSQNISPTTNSREIRSKVWVYFKQCDGDSNKVRCNLCSVELCNKGTTTILWNHVKFKHSIDKNISSKDDQDSLTELIMTPTKLRNNIKDLRQNLDFIDYNDLSLTSMKPLPSSSLSKNLLSRLNQLSSPVTRKLKFWNKKSFQVNQYDPSFKVIYLGNLGMQLWSKDESCLEKPLSTLWNNYLVNMKTEIVMRLTICNSGLKAITRQHGLTQYWSNRLVYCCSHKNYPRIFSWVYRHEGKKMRQELRCHAVFCPSSEKAEKMVIMLNQRLACALQEFKREKKSRGSSIVNDISSLQQKLPRTVPLRRQILAKGSANFRPPLERSKSAPKLTSILEEDYDDELENENEEDRTPKIECSSFFTAIEETSNSSSVCTTGDNSYVRQTSKDQLPENEILNRILVDIKDKVNRLTGVHPLVESSELEYYNQLEETLDYSSNYKMDSHTNQEIQRLSANTNTSNSFEEQLVANQDNKRKDNNSLIKHGAKIINNSSNKRKLQAAEQHLNDDPSIQEFILTNLCSNLVIK